ncbi:MAG: ABC transporter substrate-binding protein [Rhodobacteraceae bacterium]|nr:ABC transporter substrate-binding protein [Paracoccaceae bacterium]
MSKTLKTIAIAAAGVAVLSAPSFAADKVRLVNSTKVVFETEHPYTGLEEGIFKKHNLDVSVIHGSGGAASLQAVITGSQDVVWGNGVLGVLSAYAKGAPVRILGSNIRGVPDLYWYVKPESPIKSFKDLDGGKVMAYSRPGSTTDLAARFIAAALKIEPKFVSVGGPSGSRTQLMSGQVATGWSVYPLNKNLLREGKIRIIGTGKEATGLNGVTIRVIAANKNWLDKNREVAKRLMTAFDESLKMTYSNEKRLKTYAERWKLNVEDVKTATEDTPLEVATILPVAGLDKINQIALENKKIRTLLTADQLKELVHPMGNKP